MKTIKTICGITAVVGFILILGAAGSSDCGYPFEMPLSIGSVLFGAGCISILILQMRES